MNRLFLVLFTVLSVLFSTGCTTQEAPAIIVSLVADGVERVYQYSEPITVEQFLQQAQVEINTLDRINPQPWTQIFDGIRITVVRVVETEECEDVELQYQEQIRLVEGLRADERQTAQVGRSGIEEVCYRVRIEDGQRRDPVEISRVVRIEPQDQIVWVGPSTELEPIPINGTLAYISNQNAWIMRGSSTTKRPLTTSADLDSRVFNLSDDGRQLLIARTDESSDEFSNRLWIINDTTVENPEPVLLTPQDVLYAEWRPGVNNTISYSTGESRQAPPGWQALNDLWIMRIDPQSGNQINIEQVLERSTGGLYGWWGRQYEWSPDGTRLAWVQADSIGLVDLQTGTLGEPLMRYAELRPLGDWSWRTTVSWSPDNSLILTTIHGTPFGNERPEDSPVFDIAFTASDGSFSGTMIDRAGIWSSPRFSPEVVTDSPFPKGYIAYLRSREWEESIRGEYELVIADRDGSNARVIFPPAGQTGLRAQQFAQDFTWSPDGRQIALIYLGNLWVVDVETSIAHQLTQDGGASKPVWAQ